MGRGRGGEWGGGQRGDYTFGQISPPISLKIVLPEKDPILMIYSNFTNLHYYKNSSTIKHYRVLSRRLSEKFPLNLGISAPSSKT